jgi:hypothetical protein
VGLLLSAVLIGLGVLGLQTTLVSAGALHGRSWLAWALEAVDGLRPEAWMLPVGIILVLIGLALLSAAVRPRPMTAVALRAETGVFLRPRDLARLAVAVADDVNGVSDAHASATRSRVMVRIATFGDDSVAEAVRAAVAQRLEPLDKNVRVSVKTQGGAK